MASSSVWQASRRTEKIKFVKDQLSALKDTCVNSKGMQALLKRGFITKAKQDANGDELAGLKTLFVRAKEIQEKVQ